MAGVGAVTVTVSVTVELGTPVPLPWIEIWWAPVATEPPTVTVSCDEAPVALCGLKPIVRPAGAPVADAVA